MPAPNLTLGIFSAVGVIFIWSGYIVVSRVGVTTSLTAFDITALRYAVAGTIVLPFLRAWWPSHLPLRAKIVMSVCGPGALYSTLMYMGLSQSSAAWGGAFANGSLPVFTTIIGLLFVREIPGRNQIIAIAVIVTGGVLVGLPAMNANNGEVFTGIAFFLTSSAVLSLYILGVKHWQITPRQALALVNLPSLIVFLPLWYFFLPSGLAEADISSILLQALYQGLGPGFLAVILFAVAAINLGATATAGFSAAVPASASVLAIPVLGEIPTTIEWAGIATVTVGLALLVMRGK